MKVKVNKEVTLTLRIGNIIEIDDSQFSLLSKYVEVIEEKEKEVKKKKKGE